jgi:hypothetical protein
MLIHLFEVDINHPVFEGRELRVIFDLLLKEIINSLFVRHLISK